MDTLEKELAFKQLQSYSTVLSTIDDFVANIEETCKVLESNTPEEIKQKTLIDLQRVVNKKNYAKQIVDDRKDFRTTLSKFGKTIDKNFSTIPEDYKEWECDKNLINQAVAHHFFLSGNLDLASTFIKVFYSIS